MLFNIHGAAITQYIIVIIANFTFMHMGMTLAWLSPVIVKLNSINETVLTDVITESDGAWITSLSCAMAPIAMPISALLANKLGRKKAMVLGVLPKIVMCFVCLFATEVWMLFLARCLAGLSDFMTISVTPTYCSEIASKEIRGALGTLSQILSAVGSMLMLTVGPFVSYKTLNIIMTCIIVATFIPILFIPESPYFLYSKGRQEESIRSLDTIRDGKAKVDEEIEEYSRTDTSKINIVDVFKDKLLFITFSKAILIAIGTQAIGYNAISLNLQTVFILTNTNIRSEVSSAIVGCIELVACFCTLLITDRFGRKPVLGVFLIGTGIGMGCLGLFFTLASNRTTIEGFLNYLPLLSIVVALFCYNAGIGSLLWILIAELFDGKSRAMGVSACALVTTLLVFAIMRMFPFIMNTIGLAAMFWTFSACCVLFCLFILFCIPETNGRNFSNIQQSMKR